MTNENAFFIDSKYSEETSISVCGEIECGIQVDEDGRNLESITF